MWKSEIPLLEFTWEFNINFNESRTFLSIFIFMAHVLVYELLTLFGDVLKVS